MLVIVTGCSDYTRLWTPRQVAGCFFSLFPDGRGVKKAKMFALIDYRFKSVS